MIIKSLHQVRQFLSFFDWIRFSKMHGETGCRLRKKIHADNWNRLRWLRTKRFGSEELITTSVVNLSSMTLTQTQLEVLSRGPKFGIPPRAICKEEVLSEFEMYFTQVERALLESEIPTSGYAEQLVRFRTRLTDLAQRYTSVKLDHTAFPLGRDHLRAIHELRRESDVVICRPDKGTGIVLLDRADYNSKMMEILNDTSKFECLGSCEEHDRTEQIEKALQAFLLRQQKAGKIGEAVYNRIRPCGSVRPRMYGLPKIHKPEPIPLRPILSMVGSAHHELARWLTEILQPVLEHYSEHVIADSFEFCKVLHGDVELGGNAFMCSFDVTSLFTNVPIIETIQICLDALYRCDGIEAPNIVAVEVYARCRVQL